MILHAGIRPENERRARGVQLGEALFHLRVGLRGALGGGGVPSAEGVVHPGQHVGRHRLGKEWFAHPRR